MKTVVKRPSQGNISPQLPYVMYVRVVTEQDVKDFIDRPKLRSCVPRDWTSGERDASKRVRRESERVKALLYYKQPGRLLSAPCRRDPTSSRRSFRWR